MVGRRWECESFFLFYFYYLKTLTVHENSRHKSDERA